MSKHTHSNIKLFGKWPFDGIEVKEPGLKHYISLRPTLVPHSMGKHEHKRFRKTDVNIVERFLNKLMRPGKTAGKKAKIINEVKNAFELIGLRTGENPIAVLVKAIENTAPSEQTTRISFGGIVYHTAVDVAPQRRVDVALRLISEGARKTALNNPQPVEESLANELILAARNDVKSYAVSKRNEIERIARSSR